MFLLVVAGTVPGCNLPKILANEDYVVSQLTT